MTQMTARIVNQQLNFFYGWIHLGHEEKTLLKVKDYGNYETKAYVLPRNKKPD